MLQVKVRVVPKEAVTAQLGDDDIAVTSFVELNKERIDHWRGCDARRVWVSDDVESARHVFTIITRETRLAT